MLALTPEVASRIVALPRVALRGCFPHLDGGTPCLYDVQPGPSASLRLDRDARWAAEPGAAWPASDLVALRPGVVDTRELDRCHLKRSLRVGGIALDRDLPLPPLGQARYRAGERILHVEARQLPFRAGLATAGFAVACE